MSNNPFAPPTSNEGFGTTTATPNDELARRFTRFASALVDGFIAMALTIPVAMATGYYARLQAQEVGFVEQLVMSLFGMGVVLLLNGYLLATRGQSIGKFLTGIQIVDFQNGGLLPFYRVYVFRYLWLLPIVVITAAIPGTADDLLLNIVALIDSLLIFTQERRCLHDYIAGSKVVLYRPNRPKAA